MNVDKQKVQLAMSRACVGTRDLAHASGVSVQTINAAFRGQNIRPAILGRLARALNVDPADILAPDAPPDPNERRIKNHE